MSQLESSSTPIKVNSKTKPRNIAKTRGDTRNKNDNELLHRRNKIDMRETKRKSSNQARNENLHRTKPAQRAWDFSNTANLASPAPSLKKGNTGGFRVLPARLSPQSGDQQHISTA
ncbi:hypothetical protein GE21DRAFT_120 [Neurospora crassa]|uniref:Uncharacterized protein n=1 Tax=Neurospora crassa (strain ATCC 24698 / 74-OR23-1A / CBS 708.71 / DSM 1257 / FGSC 987) TaxID=367110 RepID=V5IRA5_NEUCR|nr:hypothetical protein NCU16314 [Neurospora crassa OR74A]ESA43766.1 hypothetical protein NCU16314 [Neurospora crassa OR74A]KHE84478.1 hypothetical protein GE21DRAFT_120 [Neurospora crassa]|eukprot:XP_011393330.1 hypothetical protein NCU16314 [Neurospora crassa OR74A]